MKLSAKAAAGLSAYSYKGDRRDGSIYDVTDEIELALKIALTTGRPLLVTGPSGVGKSSLAAYVAKQWGWRKCEYVVSSRSDAQDLMWRVDAVSRLAAAQLHREEAFDEGLFVEPGELWKAFDGQSAQEQAKRYHDAKRRGAATSMTDVGESDAEDLSKPAVLLIDEIDKADPEFPNALLVPLGSGCFAVPPLADKLVTRQVERGPLIIITSNDERPLPPAFLRRCVSLNLSLPQKDRMESIAHQHFPDVPKNVVKSLVGRMYGISDAEGEGKPPSPPEILDVIAACDALRFAPDDPVFDRLFDLVHPRVTSV